MGRNSKARRDARRRTGPPPRAGAGREAGAHGSPFHRATAEPEQPIVEVETEVVATLRRMSHGALAADQGPRAEALARALHPLPTSVVRTAVDGVVAAVITSRVAAGWCPDDLDQLLQRHGNATDHAVVRRWLRADLAAPGRPGWSEPGEPWRDQVARFPPGTDAGADDLSRIAATLHLGALLEAQPGLPDTTTRSSAWPVERGDSAVGATDAALTRKLATVRGLLAKAESTTYDEEAEALSAKAQELISRYALERLLEQAAGGTGPGPARARRMWLEAPYVGAKAQLVHEVAQANTCRAVLSDPPGTCTVVGAPEDLEAVELLVTSLLVQAGQAMLRHGRRVDAGGASRTRSFRHSFLMAFAVRIGERLATTAQEVMHDSGHERDLLPVLRSKQVAVEEAFAELIPSTVTRRRSVSSAAGWHAGQAAADLASLDVRRPLAEGSEGAERAG